MLDPTADRGLTAGRRGFRRGLAGLAGAVVAIAGVGVGIAAAADGDLDPSFGTGGSFAYQFSPLSGGSSSVESVAVQPDGKIVVAAVALTSGNPESVVFRLNTNGTFDQSFGSGGMFAHDFSQTSSSTESSGGTGHVAIDPVSGDIVLTDTTRDASNQSEVYVARLTPAGALDSTFGSGGVFYDQVGAAFGAAPRSSSPAGLAVQGDGTIVVDGSATGGGTGGTFLFKLSGGGNLDWLDAPAINDTTTLMNGLAVGPSGTTYAAIAEGSFSIGQRKFAVARFTAGGALDSSFGTGGSGVTPLVQAAEPGGEDYTSTPESVGVQPSGAVVASGVAGDPSLHAEGVVLRFTAAGQQLDSSFASGGLFHDQLSTVSSPRTDVNGQAIQANGDIVVSGDYKTSSGLQGFVLRLTPNGAPDPSFGTNGLVTPPVAALGYGGDYASVALDGATQLVGGGNSDADALVSRFGTSSTTTTSTTPTPTTTTPKPPVLSRVRLTHRTFRVKKAKGKTPVGTAFKFTLSAAAKVTIRFTRSGHPAGLISMSEPAGGDTITFRGRVRGKALPPGRYTATLTAVDAGGSSQPVTVRFTIAR